MATKVTEEEYAVLEACAADQKQSLSEWTREAWLAAAAEHGTEKPAVLAEVLRHRIAKEYRDERDEQTNW